MSAILQGQCKDCGYETRYFVAATGAIILDEGARIPDSYRDDQSPRVAVLAHPLAQSIEEAVEITFQEAQKAGRAVLIREQCCGACGHCYESRVLGFPKFALGCWPVIAVAVGIGVAVWMGTHSVAHTALALWITPFVVSAIIDFVAKRMILGKKTRIADPFCTSENCPECGSYFPKTRGVVPCPRCRKRRMKIEMVGIS